MPFTTTIGFERTIAMVAFCLLTWGAPSLQSKNDSPQKPTPPKIDPEVVLLSESVIQTQWPHTLSLVNAPQDISLLNPGQCIRVGIYSTGDKRDAYLESTKIAFRVQFMNHKEIHASGSLAGIKQIKPEGGDFVSAALRAGGVNQPAAMMSIASLGVSAEHWCVPIDASDGTATLDTEVDSPDGHQLLKSSTVHVESFETGAKNSFKDLNELGAFSQTYYRQPNPARLLPALQFVVANQAHFSGQGQAEIFTAFLSAALKSDPEAASGFQTRVAALPPLTRAFGLVVLRSAGYDISSMVNTMSADEQRDFLAFPTLQDPYDLTPTKALFQHLDMMWAVFGATGEFKPVQTIASCLSWRADFEDFDKQRKSSTVPKTLTPSIIRGVVYTAAGWSLSSFQKNDLLVADYIDYMQSSPETPQPVKLELAGLSSNPAFRRLGER